MVVTVLGKMSLPCKYLVSRYTQCSLASVLLCIGCIGPGGLDIGNVGGSNVEGNMEEGSRLSDDSEEDDDEITIPVSISISVPSTGSISIPVPSISVPVADLPSAIPVPSISIQVPDIQSDVPVPSISIPVLNTSKHTRPTLPPYITDHPLISKTAYETSV